MTEPKNKRKVVCISGTWDLFHVGHLSILRRAKSLGDWLIVGVNTDRYCREMGKRPIISFDQRKDIVFNLDCVDEVYPHEGADDLSSVFLEGVNVRVIGEDWGKVPGQKKALKEMENEGVKVIRLSRTPRISTEIIKKRIRNL